MTWLYGPRGAACFLSDGVDGRKTVRSWATDNPLRIPAHIVPVEIPVGYESRAASWSLTGAYGEC